MPFPVIYKHLGSPSWNGAAIAKSPTGIAKMGKRPERVYKLTNGLHLLGERREPQGAHAARESASSCPLLCVSWI